MTQAMQSETPRYWEDYEVGAKFPLGSTSFTADEIVEFARQYDPQSFHVDAVAASESMFGGLIASGWHVAAKLMRLFVDNYRQAHGPGLARSRRAALAEAGAAGRHAHRLGRVRRPGAVQKPARHGHHPRALGATNQRANW
jgi:acyl dehydratase